METHSTTSRKFLSNSSVFMQLFTNEQRIALKSNRKVAFTHTIAYLDVKVSHRSDLIQKSTVLSKSIVSL